MNIKYVGEGEVHLVAGGGKIYTDIAARIVASERPIQAIIDSGYSPQIVENILNSNHGAALEFDNFIFAISGYARVTEVQLVRKRLASYLIKSGRIELAGKRAFDIVLPKSIMNHRVEIALETVHGDPVFSEIGYKEIISIIEQWYNAGVEKNIPEQDLRYLKPQATEFKAIIGMNAHGLRDWFKIRTCANAQDEIRDLAWKMLKLCRSVAPDLFKDAGPSCVHYGYCPENKRQNPICAKADIITKDVALEYLKSYNQKPAKA